MSKIIIQINNKDLAKIIGRDEELALEITQAALVGYAERYVKPLLNGESMEAPLKRIEKNIQEAYVNKFLEKGLHSDSWKPKREIITSIEKEIDSLKKTAIYEMPGDILKGLQDYHSKILEKMEKVNDSLDQQLAQRQAAIESLEPLLIAKIEEMLNDQVSALLETYTADSLERHIDKQVKKRIDNLIEMVKFGSSEVDMS